MSSVELNPEAGVKLLRRLSAVLFDLDNTLLLYESERQYFQDYMNLIAREFASVCDPREFASQLILSTQAIVDRRHCDRTNRDAFLAHFCPAVGLDPETTMRLLLNFYRREYRRLRRHTRPIPAARAVIASARAAGMAVALATNPLFPEEAIRERLRWAQLDDVPFELITTLENMKACKPNPEYYLDIARRLGVEPHSCLMVGNDPVDDLAAGLVGMMTYLVDHGSWRDDGSQSAVPDFVGPLVDVVQLWDHAVSG